MNKEKIETICRNAGLAPEMRHKIKDANVFIADGFSAPPHDKFKRFGIEPTDFPFGCYVTLWWVSKDEELDTGQPLFFDSFHNPEYDLSFKKKARINTALQEAAGFLERRRKLNG